MDELSSPDEPRRPQNQHFDQDLSRQSMPPPSMIMQPMPQPMLAPSQLIQPQMLSQMWKVWDLGVYSTYWNYGSIKKTENQHHRSKKSFHEVTIIELFTHNSSLRIWALGISDLRQIVVISPTHRCHLHDLTGLVLRGFLLVQKAGGLGAFFDHCVLYRVSSMVLFLLSFQASNTSCRHYSTRHHTGWVGFVHFSVFVRVGLVGWLVIYTYILYSVILSLIYIMLSFLFI